MMTRINLVVIVCSFVLASSALAVQTQTLTLSFASQDQCQQTSNALMDTGLLIPKTSRDSTPCQCDQGNFSQCQVTMGAQGTNGGAVISRSACRAVIHAMADSSQSGSGASYSELSGYCADAQSNINSQIVVVADKVRSRTKSFVLMKDQASCEATRNSIIDGGLAPDLRPSKCHKIADGRVALDVFLADTKGTLSGAGGIATADCQSTASNLSGKLMENGSPKDLGISTSCAADGAGESTLQINLGKETASDSSGQLARKNYAQSAVSDSYKACTGLACALPVGKNPLNRGPVECDFSNCDGQDKKSGAGSGI